MEFKEHLQIIKSAKWFLVIFALVVGVCSFYIGYTRPTNYKAVVSFDVLMVNRDATSDYQYGAYYDLKGAEMFVQTATSWLRTPAVIEAIYKDAGIGYEIDNIDRFTNRFKTSLDSAQSFTVTYNDLSEANAQKIGVSMGKVLGQKALEVNKDSENNSLFSLKASEPVVVVSKLNIYLVIVIGVIVGLVIGTILVYLKKYFTE
jgi:capsular polysaccharide biosynthesis protein